MPDEHSEADEAREYRRALERSMTSIENHVADVAGSLEKLRATQHNLVAKTMVLDEIAANVSVISEIAKTQVEVVRTLGRMNDRLEEISIKIGDDYAELRRRIQKAEELIGKRV